MSVVPITRGGPAARRPGAAARTWAAGRAVLRRAGWRDGGRERWFLWLPVFFGAGIAGYFHLTWEPDLLTAAIPAIAGGCLHVLRRRLGGGGTFAAALLAAFLAAALGFLCAKFRTESVRAPVLARPTGLVDVTGTVEMAEPMASGPARLTLHPSTIGRLEPDRLPRRIRVHLREGTACCFPGETVRLRARLWPPPPAALPGGYDFARLAWFQRLGGVGRAASRPERTANTAPSGTARIAAAVERLREAIGQRIVAALPGETGALARALITGERGGITDATNAAYKAAGLYHILSISGLHMTVMAGAVFYAVRLTLAAVPFLALHFPIKKWAAAAAMAGAFAYLLISGGSIPAVRSALMISIVFAAILLDRPAIALRNVALSALIILGLWPESLTDPGFQMSFAAVTALVASHEALDRRGAFQTGSRRHPLVRMALFPAGIVLSTLVASFAVAPFAAFHFQEVQLYAIAANLGAVPICNLAVMPGALATLLLLPFGLESLPLWVMGQGIDAMTWCARTVAAIPGATVRTPPMAPETFAAVVCGALWFVLWRTRIRFAGLAAAVAVLAAAPLPARPGILVSPSGLAAVRGAGGRLFALPAAAGFGYRQRMFELARWLARDGDARTPGEAARGDTFRCDGIGCTARVHGVLVAVALDPAAAADDCERAEIVLIPAGRAPYRCAKPLAVIDVFDLRAYGTHALYIGGPGKVTVARVRPLAAGRPWHPPPGSRTPPKPERLPAPSPAGRVSRAGTPGPSRDNARGPVPSSPAP